MISKDQSKKSTTTANELPQLSSVSFNTFFGTFFDSPSSFKVQRRWPSFNRRKVLYLLPANWRRATMTSLLLMVAIILWLLLPTAANVTIFDHDHRQNLATAVSDLQVKAKLTRLSLHNRHSFSAELKPKAVKILGYNDHAMEPFLTRDGKYLLFNNLNDPAVNTNLHYAWRIDDQTFRYQGELKGVNTAALEGAASLDRENNLYFISPRSYEKTLATIYQGKFDAGQVTSVQLVTGVSQQLPGQVNFDAEISPDGQTLYFVDSQFSAMAGPITADIAIATRQQQGFQRLSNSSQLLATVNTAALEYAPAITADGLTLLFTRLDRQHQPLQPAIYRAQRLRRDLPFNEPQRLPLAGFVEAATFAPDERGIYFHQREGAKFVIMYLKF